MPVFLGFGIFEIFTERISRKGILGESYLKAEVSIFSSERRNFGRKLYRNFLFKVKKLRFPFYGLILVHFNRFRSILFN